MTTSAKPVEILFFEEAEVDKLRKDTRIFSGIGSLSVLYYKDTNRFELQINGWRYTLANDLTILRETNNSYIFPARNGFTFRLRFDRLPSQEALKNFETILENSSKLVDMEKVHKTTKTVAESLKGKYLTSSKKRTNLKELRTKDFRKGAQSTFEKDFFEARGKETREFLQRRRENPNLTAARNFTELIGGI